MQLFIDLLEQPHNWFYSFSILVSFGIWLVSAFGIFHTDTSVDVSHELGADLHADGFFDGLGEVMGFGMIPTSILITLIMFAQGVAGIGLNEWLLGIFAPEGFTVYLLLGVNFLISLFIGFTVAAVVSRPLRYVFKDYGTATKADSVVGKIAQVSSGKVNAESGQATLKLEDGNMIEVAVRTSESQDFLTYGQKLLILEFDKERNVYLVEKYE
jgi:Protein of unknown function (DUF1449)